MIYKRSDPAMILVERSIYVFGGDPMHAGKCEVYSIDNDKWRKIKQLPWPIDSDTPAHFGESIYLLSRNRSRVFAYDYKTNKHRTTSVSTPLLGCPGLFMISHSHGLYILITTDYSTKTHIVKMTGDENHEIITKEEPTKQQQSTRVKSTISYQENELWFMDTGRNLWVFDLKGEGRRRKSEKLIFKKNLKTDYPQLNTD